MRTMKLATFALAAACLTAGVAQAQPGVQVQRGAQAQPAQPGDRTQAVPVWRFQEAGPDGRVIVLGDDATASADHLFVHRSDYWLGVGCTPLGPEVRAHVELPAEQGLLVHGVAPGSPAAEAGIERFDILLSYGDAPLASLADLVEAVDARGTEAATLTLIRGGEQVTIEVTPVEREEDGLPVPLADFVPAVPGLVPGVPAEGAMQFRVIHPPMIALTPAASVPDGVSIQITKNGEEPAVIRVTRGEETWEATEDDLSPLPEDLRPAVAQMLHPTTAGARTLPAQSLTLRMVGEPGEGGRVLVMPAPHVQAFQLRPAVAAEASQIDESVRFQLEQIQRQLDELRRTLEAASAE